MTGFLTIDGPQRLTCDVLVIGTGAGGATAASTLAESGADVLMIEEGAYVPAAEAPIGLGQSTLKMWRGAGLLSTLGPDQIMFAEGRCVGGGTEINSAIFQRAPEEIIHHWVAANHLHDISVDSLAPYYERAAAAVNASVIPNEVGPPTTILARAGEAMGWKVSVLTRGQHHCVGANMCAAGCPTGGKQSMSSTLIPRALASGARLLARCRARYLMIRGHRANGAVCDATDGEGRQHRVTIEASAVFVCAGTMQTPLLLRRSGLGRRGGERFQLHPTVRVVAHFRDPVHAHRNRLPLTAITQFSPDMRFGGSNFSVATYALSLAEDWAHRAQWLPDYTHHAMYYAMIKPDGVGRIHPVPKAIEPIVTYRLTERDRRSLGEAVRQLALALFAAGADRVLPSIRGHEGWSSPELLRNRGAVLVPQDRALLMSIHLFGSCPMGERADCFPVDSFGRLVGMENIVLADASVLPGAPGVNPQATIMALSFRAADAFAARAA